MGAAMKSIKAASIRPFTAGDALLESERESVGGLVFYGNGGESADVGLIDIVLPKIEEDYPALKKGLQYLKFTDSEVETLYNVIGGAINTVGGIISIVGAAGAVVDLLGKLGLFGPQEDPTQAALRQIGERIEQIYGYLAAEERRGLSSEAIDWRVAATQARNELTNVRISRDPMVIDKLVDRAATLDGAILTMLDVGKANIAFLRDVYGYHAHIGHWIDAAAAPFMSEAAGAPVNYREPAQNLQGEIWDPGHYFDVLLGSLTDRIAVAAAIEPAFRSTGYDRAKMASIAVGLGAFVNKWRSSILIADPAAGINNGGQLQNPTGAEDAPTGIVLGAVDPVTGVSSFMPYWDGFTKVLKRNYFPGEAWGGVYDEARAKDPAAALAAARSVQAPLVDAVIRGSGLARFSALRTQFQLLGSVPLASEFVQLSDPLFRPIGFAGPRPVGDTTTVDLGFLKHFATDPNKTYPAQLYSQMFEKTFKFSIARRAEVSKVQLGYRLLVADESIELVPFSQDHTQPTHSFEAIDQRISFRIRSYDCYQSKHLSMADENEFERNGTFTGGQRLFLNELQGEAEVDLLVEFPAVPQRLGAYRQDVVVKVRSRQEGQPKAFILPVAVYETRIGGDLSPEEVIAEQMTVHMVPAYYLLGTDYFADRADATARMTKTVKGINDKFAESHFTVGPPNPDPAWAVLRPELEALQAQQILETALRNHGDETRAEIAMHLPPTIQR